MENELRDKEELGNPMDAVTGAQTKQSRKAKASKLVGAGVEWRDLDARFRVEQPDVHLFHPVLAHAHGSKGLLRQAIAIRY